MTATIPATGHFVSRITAQEPGNLIFALELAPGTDQQLLADERNRWAKKYADPLRTTWRPHLNIREGTRKLRIGYVSADFREHSAAYVFGALLTKFDRTQFEVFAYSNCDLIEGMTRLFQEDVTCWRDISKTSDDDAAAMIRRDKIDILVDLSGHSGGNRLLLFARKPAPIQCTGWGYATSTGMRAMDYFFTDRYCVPEIEAHYYTETLCYLPCLVTSYFPFKFPDVKPLPWLANDFVTFGCYNRLAKISNDAMDAWRSILARVANSRMIIKCGEFDKPENMARVREYMRLPPDRLELIGVTPKLQHVTSFNRIDIALDPFPQCGGVTAMEGFMMGVPLVTMHGNLITSRGASSINHCLGLDNWIAKSWSDYVDLAYHKANYPGALLPLRRDLREIFKASPVGNNTAYVRIVENEYVRMWRRWLDDCADQRA